MRKITVLLAVVLLVGCKDSKIAIEHSGLPASRPQGRYQIVINPHPFTGGNTEAFLIDTERGRVWEYKSFFTDNKGKNHTAHLTPLDIIDNEKILGMDSFDFYEKERLMDQETTKVETKK